MLRDEWRFPYSGKQIAEAAAMQRDFRISRIRVWEDQKATVMARIRESGIDVTESIASNLSDSPKYLGTQSRRGAQITIDARMQDDLNECVDKIREHTRLRNEYAAWYQMFVANPNSMVELTHDDWVYFFLRSLGTDNDAVPTPV